MIAYVQHTIENGPAVVSQFDGTWSFVDGDIEYYIAMACQLGWKVESDVTVGNVRTVILV